MYVMKNEYWKNREFFLGMKKEYILSEDEKRQKKQKIEENRVRKRQYSAKGNSPLADESLPDSPQSGSMSPKNTVS